MTVPVRLEDVTPEWLETALRACGALVDERVAGARLEPMGTFSSQLVRVHLRYHEPRAGRAPAPPARLVLKLSPAGGRERSGERLAGEIRFYRELASRVPARVPRFHHGEVDARTGRGCLLLEDVTGVAETDWLRGPDEAHAQLAVTAMARLHAAFWGRVGELGWIPHFGDPEVLADFERAYARNWPVWRDFFVGLVPAAGPLGDALVGRLAATHAHLGADATLLHGDAHAENMPVAGAAARAGGREVVLLDWAAVRRGAPGLDLGFFVPMSFPAERRPGIERELVELHRRTLEQQGVRPGVDAWLGYRRGVLRRFSRIVEIADGWDARALSGLRMIFQRCATAAVELGVGDLIDAGSPAGP